ncbi:MAG: hypothetical protein A2W03_03045 [Candidatus Aminicenantes bacterium RBG_16_63_16]|nr:MAG: hypothetical protein A2W03_03045 [Candidatus Aminicenantes bacterium RBG_16_63_16]
MVKNEETVRRLERSILRREKPDYLKNSRLVEAMYKEAVILGAFPLKDKLSGLDIDIKIARTINSVSKTP